MAPRANWKGFLRLSLVTCPVALFPATSDSEKISFNQINRKTGHRIKYAKVDADTGEEVSNNDIMKGYKVDTDTYIEVLKDELENIALKSRRRLCACLTSTCIDVVCTNIRTPIGGGYQ
jgi:DNA end-binding protein Ku